MYSVHFTSLRVKYANMNKKSNVTILVLSCDKYQDLWKPFFYCFRKFWKNCPYPVYLGSNTISCKEKNVQTILSGSDKDWSSSLLSILRKIETPYIFLWLDDIFPIRTIDQTKFAEALDFMVKHKARHMHVEPTPRPDKVLDGHAYGVYQKGAPYRGITFGFWEVASLTKLLIPGENPWNFEILGSYRTSYLDGFYCAMKNLIPRLHVVEKGKIFQEAYTYCRDNDVPLDLSKRPVLASGSFVKSQMQKYYFNAMIRVPWNIRLSMMNVLRKLLISY